jgi:hypothetical protein
MGRVKLLPPLVYPVTLAVGLAFFAAFPGCSEAEHASKAPDSVPASGRGAGGAGRAFSPLEEDGAWWLSGPAGKPFVSLGVCVLDQGIARERYDPSRPGYASWRHYPTPTAWADAVIERLHAWGFTTIGGWGDTEALRRSGRMDLAMTPVLAAGMEAGAPWLDLWDPKVFGRIEELARERVLRVRDDPRLIGYYTDNELGWWNGALFKMTLEHPAGSGQRQRLVRLLREAYRSDWSALLRDFDPEGAASFDDLERKGMLYLRPGGEGIGAMRGFLAQIAERYYELLGGIVRRYDSRSLILGDRYQSFYYPEVARAAARHADIISTNLNAQWSDGTFARFYLDTLHELTGKPVIVSEFYLAAAENRSRNPNRHGLYPVVRTQKERAEGFRRTLTAVFGLPYVVGADWFQYYDEPPGGRFDGEDLNFGLVDIDDRPYEELIATVKSIHASSLHRQATAKRPDSSGGVPPAPQDPLGRFEPNLALGHWDRERGFVRPCSLLPLADLYLAWSPESIYLGLLSLDPIEEACYRDGRIPEVDRPQWTVEVDGPREPIRLRLGAGLPPSGAPEGATVVSLSGKEVGVRMVAALRLPAQLFGRKELTEGDSFRLSSSLMTYARAHRVEWKGEFQLAR